MTSHRRFWIYSPGYVSIQDSFEHFLIFNAAPGGSVADDVPLEAYKWNWNTSNHWDHAVGTDQYWNLPVKSILGLGLSPDPFPDFVWNSNFQNQ